MSGVTLSGLESANSPFWNIHLGWCDDVHVRGIRVVSPPLMVNGSSNADGIDLDACQRVVVEDSVFDVNDDAVCLKSGVDWFGRTYGRPTKDVLVRNITIIHGEGPAIGSEQSGGVSNVTFEDIFIGAEQVGPVIKSCRGRGGLVENVTFRNIVGDGVATVAPPVGAGQPWPQLWLRMVYPCPNRSRTNATATPTFRNILYENILLRHGGQQMSIQGLPESPIRNVRFKNVTFIGSGPPPWPYRNASTWGPCENVDGSCDRDTPVGSCPPCFHHDHEQQTKGGRSL